MHLAFLILKIAFIVQTILITPNSILDVAATYPLSNTSDFISSELGKDYIYYLTVFWIADIKALCKCKLPVRSRVILQVFTLWYNIEHWGNAFRKLQLWLMGQSWSGIIVHFSQISPHWWGFTGRRYVFVSINLMFRTGVDHLWSLFHLSLSNILAYLVKVLISSSFYHQFLFLKSAKQIYIN